jgi:hypothetical protein
MASYFGAESMAHPIRSDLYKMRQRPLEAGYVDCGSESWLPMTKPHCHRPQNWRVASVFPVFVQSTRHQPTCRAVPVAQADVPIRNILDTS